MKRLMGYLIIHAPSHELLFGKLNEMGSELLELIIIEFIGISSRFNKNCYFITFTKCIIYPNSICAYVIRKYLTLSILELNSYFHFGFL